jgi:hypothetical protein
MPRRRLPQACVAVQVNATDAARPCKALSRESVPVDVNVMRSWSRRVLSGGELPQIQ